MANFVDQNSQQDFIDNNSIALFIDQNGIFLGLGGAGVVADSGFYTITGSAVVLPSGPSVILMPMSCM